jgi:hypothetical protein
MPILDSRKLLMELDSPQLCVIVGTKKCILLVFSIHRKHCRKIAMIKNQCCGSGSVESVPKFLGHPNPLVRGTYGSGSGFFVSPKQKLKENLDCYCLWLLYDFLSLKNDVNVASKSNQQKT